MLEHLDDVQIGHWSGDRSIDNLKILCEETISRKDFLIALLEISSGSLKETSVSSRASARSIKKNPQRSYA